MTYHGILPVRKARGYTSHDVVAKVRRLFGQKRVGHTGTLDPEVEGVLPICLGQATRVVEYIQELPKRYQGSMVLGISTDTQDQTGAILEQVTVPPIDEATIRAVFARFQGEIEQVPPMYSAVKVKGQRLYDLARAGKQVERAARKVVIYQLTCTQFIDGEHPEIHFDVLCSKGTYVRTLCVDIGAALGLPAHMNRLIRTESGPFRLEDCYTLEELAEASEEGRLGETLVALDEGVSHFPRVTVDEATAQRVLDGQALQMEAQEEGLVRVYSTDGRFCALYQVKQGGVAKPEKVFRELE